MPPKKRRPGGKGKKGRRKGKKKGKKGKKKAKILQNPPPLHVLTELYKKLDEETKMLYEMRIAARRKRIECWFMAREMMNAKNDNARYHDIVEENMIFLKKAMDKLKKLLQDEMDSINKAIQQLIAEYKKKRQEFLRQTELIEEELAKVKQELLEFQPLMDELERLMARLAELEREIAKAQMEADVKIRHLTNQFLDERSKLHNHLEDQLYNLIKHCRSFIMPLLWNFMQDLSRENMCARWRLARTDEKYIALSEQRDPLIHKRKMLTLEKPYWNIEWSFQKMEEMDLERRRQRKLAREAFKTKMARGQSISWSKKTKPRELETGPVTAVEKFKAFVISAPNKPHQETLNVSTQLGRDFNAYLMQKLTAAREAQEREARAHRREEKRFLKKVLEEADGENLEGEGFLYEGEEEGEGDWDEDDERHWADRLSFKKAMRESFAADATSYGQNEDESLDEEEGDESEWETVEEGEEEMISAT